MRNVNQDIPSLLEDIISQLEEIEITKDELTYQIKNILETAKEAGFNKDILQEMIEIRKVQKDNPSLSMDPDKLYANLLKWQEEK